jgi:mannose-1-phosphate guanylyltransferase / phosphomannomutase
VGVDWTKLSGPALMAAACEPGVGFAGNQDGNFILPGFLPGFDAAATLVKVLDLLTFHERRLSDVVARLPRVNVVQESVVTPWDQKGTVMRTLMEQSKDREVVLVDGVKVIHDDAWALALPDPEEPFTHIWAEAESEPEARRLAQEYVRRIRQMAQ